MVLKLPWAQKQMFWASEKGIFQFFASFWVTKLTPFSGKVRQSVQDYLNQNLNIVNSKMNVVSVLKEHFSVFCKFLSDGVETSFCESEAKRSKLFKSKFGHKNLLKNGLEATWISKMNVVTVLKCIFSVFCKFLSDVLETIFW